MVVEELSDRLELFFLVLGSQAQMPLTLWCRPGAGIKNTNWLVVDLPLWKIWKSIGMMIPNIWENQKCSKPPTSKVPTSQVCTTSWLQVIVEGWLCFRKNRWTNSMFARTMSQIPGEAVSNIPRNHCNPTVPSPHYVGNNRDFPVWNMNVTFYTYSRFIKNTCCSKQPISSRIAFASVYG